MLMAAPTEPAFCPSHCTSRRSALHSPLGSTARTHRKLQRKPCRSRNLGDSWLLQCRHSSSISLRPLRIRRSCAYLRRNSSENGVPRSEQGLDLFANGPIVISGHVAEIDKDGSTRLFRLNAELGLVARDFAVEPRRRVLRRLAAQRRFKLFGVCHAAFSLLDQRTSRLCSTTMWQW